MQYPGDDGSCLPVTHYIVTYDNNEMRSNSELYTFSLPLTREETLITITVTASNTYQNGESIRNQTSMDILYKKTLKFVYG